MEFQGLPVWVLMCLLRRLGRSKAFPQTSHGRRFRSPRGARCFGGATIVVSIKSPELELPEDVYESPEIDLRSSSVLAGDEIGGMMSATSDIDRSKGESGRRRKVEISIRIVRRESGRESRPLNQLT
jgi:hypothetical protein